MQSIKKFIKKQVPVSWRNPFIATAVKLIDPIDYILRASKGFANLPPYSVRIRSNGMKNQFGGEKFNELGNTLANLLKEHAGVNQNSSVLEIGCGCGRTAIQLSNFLSSGSYTGMDIDKKSLEACLNNKYLSKNNIKFYFVDVYNNEYNPQGKTKADHYVFPYPDGSFDTIFLISVFTHMLTSDVKNYIKEISRLLQPGGICMISTFLMGYGKPGKSYFTFKHKQEDHFYDNEVMPEVAVGYNLDFYLDQFKSHGVVMHREPLYGSWRNDPETESGSGFSQDLIFFKKV
jgi:SAM-dependent methyltransferase